MADTLNFGPQWLRALSDGGAITSPPPSPFPSSGNKYKLAEYRYGREDLLAMFDASCGPPDDLRDIPQILVDKPQHPLVFSTPSEEEQRLLSSSVNSTVVLRMMGRGGGPPTRGGGRGASMERGRGRGRGRGDGYYPRGFEEESGGFGRGRRPESWDDLRDKRYDRPYHGRTSFDEGPVSPRREFSRSMSSDNWREPKREDDNNDGDWRKIPSRDKWGARNWREPRERWGEREFAGREGGGPDRYNRSRSWEEEGDLPEWSTADADNMEDLGTFDSSGAFMSLKELEEAEVKDRDKRPNRSDNRENVKKSTPSPRSHEMELGGEDWEAELEPVPVEDKQVEKSAKSSSSKDNSSRPAEYPRESERTTKANSAGLPNGTNVLQDNMDLQREPAPRHEDKAKPNSSNNNATQQSLSNKQSELSDSSSKKSKKKGATAAAQKQVKLPKAPTEGEQHQRQHVQQTASADSGSSKQDTSRTSPAEPQREIDDAFQLIAKATEDMMASWTAEEDEKNDIKARVESGSVPTDHEDAKKWFYRDPQGDLQGPFSSPEMAEWFSAGYFTRNLLVKRGCDECFQPLGELIKRWGRVPFSPGPSIPPLKASSVGVAGVPTGAAGGAGVPQGLGALLAEGSPDQVHMLQQQLVMQQQLLHQHAILRQQMQLQQLMQQLNQHDITKLSPQQQQQQLALQLMLKQQAALLQQQQAAAVGAHPQMAAQKLSPTSAAEVPVNQAGLAAVLQHNLAAQQNQPPITADPAVSSYQRAMPQPAMPKPVVSEVPTPQPQSQPQPPPQSVWGATAPPKSVSSAGSWGATGGSVWDIDTPRSTESLQSIELERHKQKEQAQIEMELRQKREEAMRKHQDDEVKRQQERQEVEMKRQRDIEELRRKQEEEIRRKQEEELRRKQEEQRKLEEELQRKREEEDRRRADEDRRLKDSERVRLEQLKRDQEKREKEAAAEEDRRKKAEAERRKQEQDMEMRRQDEIRRRQEKAAAEEVMRRQQQQAALKKLQQDQLAKIKLPAAAQWASNTSNGSHQSSMTLSEIQQQEQERLEQEQQDWQVKLQHQQMAALQQQQQQQKATKSWTQQMQSNGPPSGAPSLLDIQNEQARQLDQDHQQKKATAAHSQLSLAAAGSWGSSAQSAGWASEGTWGSSNSLGFWDDAINSTAPSKPKQSVKQVTSQFPSLNPQVPTASGGSSKSGKANRTKKEEESVQRLFSATKPKPNDEFTLWCEQAMHGMNSSVDIPTFISFLQEVDSPYEVHDYVRSYLGDNKKTNEFAKTFLEKRSYYRGLGKPRQEEAMWGPAPAINPGDSRGAGGQAGADQASDERGSNKRKNKKKMQKVDNSQFLGFTVHQSSERVNVGQIESSATETATS